MQQAAALVASADRERVSITFVSADCKWCFFFVLWHVSRGFGACWFGIGPLRLALVVVNGYYGELEDTTCITSFS